MKRYLLILLLFTAHSTLAQHVDSVEWFFDHSMNKTTKDDPDYTYYSKAYKIDRGLWYQEVFYAGTNSLYRRGTYLNDNMTNGDSKFTYYHRNGRVEAEIAYRRGEPFGLWVRYHDNGKLADSVDYAEGGMPYGKTYKWDREGHLSSYGVFDPGQTGAGYETAYYKDSTISRYGKYAPGFVKDSIWTYYHANGELAGLETWESGKWIKFECFDEAGRPHRGCDTIVMAEPEYDVYKYIAKKLKVPKPFNKKARATHLSGKFKVLLQFTIYEDGEIHDVIVLKGDFKELNEAAQAVCRSMPPWRPGREHNRKVKVYYTLPVTYHFDNP